MLVKYNNNNYIVLFIYLLYKVSFGLKYYIFTNNYNNLSI